jgi:hypothetical protein
MRGVIKLCVSRGYLLYSGDQLYASVRDKLQGPFVLTLCSRGVERGYCSSTNISSSVVSNESSVRMQVKNVR